MLLYSETLEAGTYSGELARSEGLVCWKHGRPCAHAHVTVDEVRPMVANG